MKEPHHLGYFALVKSSAAQIPYIPGNIPISRTFLSCCFSVFLLIFFHVLTNIMIMEQAILPREAMLLGLILKAIKLHVWTRVHTHIHTQMR